MVGLIFTIEGRTHSTNTQLSHFSRPVMTTRAVMPLIKQFIPLQGFYYIFLIKLCLTPFLLQTIPDNHTLKAIKAIYAIQGPNRWQVSKPGNI